MTEARLFGLGLFIGGLVLAWFAVYWWRGRSDRARQWMGDAFYGWGAIALAPGGSIALIGGGLGFLTFEWLRPLGLACFAVAVAGAMLMLWGWLTSVLSLIWWPAHRLWGPRWYTRLTKEQLRDYELGDMSQATMRQLGIGPESWRRPSWLGERRAQFWASRFADPDLPSRRRATHGWLSLCEHGVWFDPSPAHADVRSTVEEAFSWEELTDVRVVAGTENARGDISGGLRDRSWMKRLVLETSRGVFLFEVTGRKAEAVRERLLAERRGH